jgi:hypothetical protein
MVDGIKEKHNVRCQGRSWYEMIEMAKTNLDSTSEIVAYHKVKRIFLNLIDMEKEDPNEILTCEFRSQYPFILTFKTLLIMAS